MLEDTPAYKRNAKDFSQIRKSENTSSSNASGQSLFTTTSNTGGKKPKSGNAIISFK